MAAGAESVRLTGQLASLVTYGLPDNYFNNYIANVQAVSLADINRVANKYLQPDRMTILIVGDKNVIEPGLKSIDSWGERIYYLDNDGDPLTK